MNGDSIGKTSLKEEGDTHTQDSQEREKREKIRRSCYTVKTNLKRLVKVKLHGLTRLQVMYSYVCCVVSNGK